MNKNPSCLQGQLWKTDKKLNKWIPQVNQAQENFHWRNNQINFLNKFIYILKGNRPMIKETKEGVYMPCNHFLTHNWYKNNNKIKKGKHQQRKLIRWMYWEMVNSLHNG